MQCSNAGDKSGKIRQPKISKLLMATPTASLWVVLPLYLMIGVSPEKANPI
jgi:hypothetical protein